MKVRDNIADFLKRELVGPDPGLPLMQLNREEVLRSFDPPRSRYGAGILFPLRAEVMQQDNFDLGDVKETEAIPLEESGVTLQSTGEEHTKAAERGETSPETDYEIGRANEYLPSAMGLTALVRLPQHLLITVKAGRYERHEYGDVEFWWRIPIRAEVRLQDTELQSDTPLDRPLIVDGHESPLHLHVLSRPVRLPGAGPENRLITFALVNRNTSESERPKDEDCFFQCEFVVEDPSGDDCFLEYPETLPDAERHEEEETQTFLYRNRRVFAVGHGCAPEWTEATSTRAVRIWSSSLPTYEMKPIVPCAIEGLDLQMLALSQHEGSGPVALCTKLADSYETWISESKRKIESTSEVPAKWRSVAEKNLEKCRACLERIRYGIELLGTDPLVRDAFALMNRAMLMQQLHYHLSTDSIRKWKRQNGQLVLEQVFDPPEHNDPTRIWRPFQLAFILMTLRSVVEPTSEDRNTVDLIWFPTGGGKTEAYLGLAAFTIFFRRLSRSNNGGTAVLMRYTLRLLTTQQYQRAASLICACEKIRRERAEELGQEPITIGLWVGGAVTPNREQQAVTALGDMLRGERENPFVIISCPWCGAQMGTVKEGGAYRCKGYRKLRNPSRVRLICDDNACEFSSADGLPLQVIDEHIYFNPPTLLIGTVDKFALLPWIPEARSLFGLNSSGVHDPPELIIQDELHLISGPLGSMVGHYETLIDALCERDLDGHRIGAKIVASTATISRAPEQIKALYSRDSAFLFPPQGLRAGYSFFAEEAFDKPGRTYAGVFCSGLPSPITTQVRVLAALLQGPCTVEEAHPKDLDPYWTLMVYFNSMRELGHAATLIRADIKEYLRVVAWRKGFRFKKAQGTGPVHRSIRTDMELTSRIPSSEVAEVLQRLFTPYDGNQECGVIDVCLATNMIQVGLDVPRLSLMTIVGQPKTVSEYIQASSRVGRYFPGLVVTILHPGKPRDRSHFEHFRAFHQSIYRNVEPTSVTPFAVPVRERALHALLITLVRFWGDENMSRTPNPPPPSSLVDRIRDFVLHRVENISPEEVDNTRTLIDEIFREWDRLPPRRYGSFVAGGTELPLMYPSGTASLEEWDEQPHATPTSMRNVDASCSARPILRYPQPEV